MSVDNKSLFGMYMRVTNVTRFITRFEFENYDYTIERFYCDDNHDFKVGYHIHSTGKEYVGDAYGPNEIDAFARAVLMIRSHSKSSVGKS